MAYINSDPFKQFAELFEVTARHEAVHALLNARIKMTIVQSIVLGIIQGITEFLPISSSGHLILLPRIFNWPDQGLAYDAVIHLATGLSIILALRKDIFKILSGFNLKRLDSEYRKNRKLIGLIVLAMIPAGIAGLMFNNLIEEKLRMVEVVAWSLIVWGAVLYGAEYYNKKLQKKDSLESVSWKQSLGIGVMQVLALIPGTSRSGITITGGLFAGMSRVSAVKFSFLIGLPLILGAGSLKFVEIVRSGELAGNGAVLLVGFISAFVSGVIAIKLLLWVAEKANFNIFVVYRILLGVGLLLFF